MRTQIFLLLQAELNYLKPARVDLFASSSFGESGSSFSQFTNLFNEIRQEIGGA